MKPFKPTYLYVKTHNVTGLKYFGKTTSKRKNYKGSGTYWLAHIKKYGYDVTTEIVGYFTDPEECMKFALDFSTKNNIVESEEWANLSVENGRDGGDTFTYKSDVEKQTINEKRKQQHKNKSEEELEKIRKKNSTGVKKYIRENSDIRKQTAKKIVEKRKASGKDWHSEETKLKIKSNNKAGTPEVREKLRAHNLGKKNPEHSLRMIGRTGVKCPNTRIFLITSPKSIETTIYGCSELRTFCKKNEIAYEQLLRHINCGIITEISAKKPRQEMLNVIGFQIKEIKNDLYKKV